MKQTDRERVARLFSGTMAAVVTIGTLQGVFEPSFEFLAIAAMAAGSLYIAFANALLLAVRGNVDVPFYHGTEMDSREEFEKRPHGSFGNIFIPLSFGLFFLLAIVIDK